MVIENFVMALIQLQGVCKTYFTGEVPTPVLHDISLDVEAGDFVSITGPSGAGKSTLLHILGFLDNQTGGKYFFDGKRMDRYTDIEMARIRNEKMGFVFQSFNLLPRTSVLENVKLPLLYSRKNPDEWEKCVIKAIDEVGLSHRTWYEPSQLSGGERQRVAIARALVNNPSVIFADEPTGNLDTHSGDSIMKILRKLNRGGHTIILITHEPHIARQAKRMIHIVDGKIDSDVVNRKR